MTEHTDHTKGGRCEEQSRRRARPAQSVGRTTPGYTFTAKFNQTRLLGGFKGCKLPPSVTKSSNYPGHRFSPISALPSQLLSPSLSLSKAIHKVVPTLLYQSVSCPAGQDRGGRRRRRCHPCRPPLLPEVDRRRGKVMVRPRSSGAVLLPA